MKNANFLKITLGVLLAVVLVYALPTCKKEVKPVVLTYPDKVIVVVNDRTTGLPVANARIQVFDYLLDTDEEGKVLFELPALTNPADVKLIAAKAGYGTIGFNLDYRYLRDYRSLTMYVEPIETQEFISGNGGAVTDENNNQVIVPEGTFPGGSVLFVKVQTFTTLPVVEECLPLVSIEIQSSVKDLQQPVELRLAVNPDDGYAPGDEVPLLYYDESILEWTDTGKNLVVSPDGTYMSVQVDHFSTYASGYWHGRNGYDWELVTEDKVVNENSRENIYTYNLCNTLPNGNACKNDIVKDGKADHVYDVSVPQFTPANKFPGQQAIIEATTQIVIRDLAERLPYPGMNYRLLTGYDVCTDPCSCRDINVDIVRETISYTTLPILKIKVGDVWYSQTFTSASISYNDLDLIIGAPVPLDPAECHEGGGGQ